MTNLCNFEVHKMELIISTQWIIDRELPYTLHIIKVKCFAWVLTRSRQQETHRHEADVDVSLSKYAGDAGDDARLVVLSHQHHVALHMKPISVVVSVTCYRHPIDGVSMSKRLLQDQLGTLIPVHRIMPVQQHPCMSPGQLHTYGGHYVLDGSPGTKLYVWPYGFIIKGCYIILLRPALTYSDTYN